MLCVVPVQMRVREGSRVLCSEGNCRNISVFQERDGYQRMENNWKAKRGVALKNMCLVKIPSRL